MCASMQIVALISVSVGSGTAYGADLMANFSELRSPMRWYIKLLTAVLALVFFAVLATLAIAGFLVYGSSSRNAPAAKSTCRVFPGDPMRCSFRFRAGPGLAKVGSFRDFAARRRLFFAMDMGRAKASC